LLASDHVCDRGAAEAQADVAVPTAAVVGVGGGDQSAKLRALVGNQQLTVVGLEVGQGQVASKGGLLVSERIGVSDSDRVVAQPLTDEPAQRRLVWISS